MLVQNQGKAIQQFFVNQLNLDLKQAWIETQLVESSISWMLTDNMMQIDLNAAQFIEQLLKTNLDQIIHQTSKMQQEQVQKSLVSQQIKILDKDLLLEIMSVANIAQSLEKRYTSTPKSTLKLLLTNGVICYHALVLDKINVQSNLTHNDGLKILVRRGTLIRHGVLCLTNSHTIIIRDKVTKYHKYMKLLVQYD